MTLVHLPRAVLLALALGGLAAHADIGANQQVQMEAQLQHRILTIVQKGDRGAIVQVKVDVKRISSALPGVWADASSVTPVVGDGSLATDGIDGIHVRVLTQVAELPAWIQDEVKKALQFDKIKVDTKFEKAKGKISAEGDSMSDVIKNFGKELTVGLSQSDSGKIGHDITFAIWGVVAGLAATFLILFAAIFMLGRRIESAFFRVVEEKLAPLMQTPAPVARRERGEGADKRDEAAAPVASAAAARGEFADLANAAVLALVLDCYWTHSDGYANFIWGELDREQREYLLGGTDFGPELYRYFTYARQFAAVNLGYHRDVRYSDASPIFAKVDQSTLSQIVTATPAHAAFVTPLRWDFLPVSLADRMKVTVALNANPGVRLSVPPTNVKPSPLRTLPRKLEVKTLSAADESYLWENALEVPADLRAGLKTLVWLALTPLEYREKVLAELDARDLAEAWSGPDDVLEKLKEAVPVKKFEMVRHFMKDAAPDRDGSMFAHLVAMGVAGPTTPPVERATAA